MTAGSEPIVPSLPMTVYQAVDRIALGGAKRLGECGYDSQCSSN